MSINGLLLTLSDEDMLVQQALDAIKEHSQLEIGGRSGRWQPLVVESNGTGDSHDIHEWLQALDGVVKVDVIFTSVDEPSDHKPNLNKTQLI